jgi:manganese/zinc/iron transport system permease protein
VSEWTWAIDGWIVAIGALAAVACAIPGVFLVVRREAMLADAISHAALPGIAGAFLMSGTRDPLWMFLGAVVAGLVVALGARAIAALGRIEPGAALGIAFTTLFALGLVAIVQVADRVDLDPSCVLFGSLELAPLDSVRLAGVDLPRAAVVLVAVVLLNAALAAAFWKELTTTAFDPALAKALGLRPRMIECLVLSMAAATCVAAFEAVGSILIVAMFVIPAASARLVTHRLVGMIVAAMGFGVAGAMLGHWMATSAAPTLLPEGRDASTAGAIAAALGVMFALAALLSPQRGAIRRVLDRAILARRTLREDALGLLWRLEEDRHTTDERGLAALLVREADGCPRTAARAIRRLVREQLLQVGQGGVRLTDAGRRAGAELVRSHRLWELYLARRLALAPDHVHDTAMELEHITDATMREQLAREGESGGVGANGLTDPHGRPVPGGPQ